MIFKFPRKYFSGDNNFGTHTQFITNSKTTLYPILAMNHHLSNTINNKLINK